MNREEFKKFIDEKFGEVLETFVAKSSQYASNMNVFEEFEKGAKVLETTPQFYLLSLMQKHKNVIDKQVKKNEIIEDENLRDVVLYLFLLWAMNKERKLKEGVE